MCEIGKLLAGVLLAGDSSEGCSTFAALRTVVALNTSTLLSTREVPGKETKGSNAEVARKQI